MKKLHLLFGTLAVVLTALFSISLTSCEDEIVVGTWNYNDGSEMISFTFEDGGSGTWVARFYDSYSGSNVKSGSFTYVMEGDSESMGKIYLRESYSTYSDVEILYFVIEGKNMMRIFSDYYYDDEEFVLIKQ